MPETISRTIEYFTPEMTMAQAVHLMLRMDTKLLYELIW